MHRPTRTTRHWILAATAVAAPPWSPASMARNNSTVHRSTRFAPVLVPL